MPLNPFGVGLMYWNNWLQSPDAEHPEFVILTAELKVYDGVLHWSMGAVGFGFVLCWKIPW